MRRRTAAVFGMLALFAATQTGVWELVEHAAEVGCVADCPDDEEDSCPPGCEACVCCPTIRIAVAEHYDVVLVEHAVVTEFLPVADDAPAGVTHRVFRPPRRALHV